jgi:hypothetical protein
MSRAALREHALANSVEMLSGRRKKDYAAESAAEALAAQAEALGVMPASSDDDAGESTEANEAVVVMRPLTASILS